MTPPRKNPYAAARFAPGALPWIGELDSLVDRATTPDARLQILGPNGSGKSTLLVHLERGLSRRGWNVCSFRGSRGFDWASLVSLHRDGPSAILVDEVEELGSVRLALLRACSSLRGASLVVTAHRDIGFETLCERAVDAETVHELCSRLLDGVEPPPPAAIGQLLARHRGNVREVFFELYDDVARSAAIARVRP